MESKEIDKYPGYFATSEGHIIGPKGKVLKEYVINSGYAQIAINGHKKLVHRVVAYAFCPGYSKQLVVNHKNANRLDNRPSNLEWVTTKENIADMKNRGVLDTHSARKRLAEVSLKPVWQCTKEGVHINRFSSLTEASEALNLSTGHISQVLSGERHTTGGFHWEYANKDQANIGRTLKHRI